MSFRAALFLAATLLAPSLWAATPTAVQPRTPYTFEQNLGQAHSDVLYQARGDSYALFLTDREAVLSLSQPGRASHTLRMSLEGGLQPTAIRPLDAQPHRTNYFIGAEPENWRIGAPHFARVLYEGVYEGVDLVFHSAADRLEYDFIVAPGTSPSVIRLRFAGADWISVNASAELELASGAVTVTHQAPVAYQEVHGERRTVAAAYQIEGGMVGFRLGNYDSSQPLIIDPVVVYSSFLGGGLTDSINAVAVDPQGNIYLTGETTSSNFPVVGAPLTPNSGAVVYSFITKLDRTGAGIVYSTILGGSSNTRGYAIQADAQGHAFVAGVTGARDLPLVNPVQSQQPGLNIGYVAKLNPEGNALLFSTYLGGARNDEINALALDPAGNIHVAGRATSTLIPLVNPLQPNFGGDTDILIAKYVSPDYRLAYSTYLGKTGLEFAYGVAADAGGFTYVTGVARGESLATAHAFQDRVKGGNDAFLAKIAPSGNQVEWFTYFGEQGDEQARGVALDREGSIWIAGSTTSPGFVTTPNAVQRSLRGESDAFVVKFHQGGGNVYYSTLLGSSSTAVATREEALAIKLDGRGAVYIAGVTNGSDFPAVRPLQAFGGGVTDGFLTKLSPAADAIEHSTPIGGSADDFLNALAVDVNGGAYVGGRTLSINFPLKAAIRSTFAGSEEGFFTKVCDPVISPSESSVWFGYHQGDPYPLEARLEITSCTPIPFSVSVSGEWLRATPTSGSTNQTLILFADPEGLEPGTYYGMIVLTALDAINSPREVPIRLVVLPPQPVISAAGIVNAASGKGGSVTPGQIVTLYGAHLGPNELTTAVLDEEGRVVRELARTRVRFDEYYAPVIYTSAGQVSAVVPYGVGGRVGVQIHVEYYDQLSNIVQLPVDDTGPGVFTLDGSGSGQGAILHADYSVNTQENPAGQGDIVLLYVTGEGQTIPGGVDGQLATAVLAKPVEPVSVTIGGTPAMVEYSGSAPGMVAGVMQVNARIPNGISSGLAEVVVTVGHYSSQPGVFVSVR